MGVGLLCPFPWAEAGSPSNTISPGPRPTSVQSAFLIHPAVWPKQTWTENWWSCALFGGYLGPSPYNTMSPGPRPTSIASGILIHHRYRQTDRQRSDSIERTVLQTVAENPVNVRYSTQSSLRQLRCIHSFMRSFIITYVYTSTICKWDSRTLRITCSSPGGGLT